jgi:hypothetical protein
LVITTPAAIPFSFGHYCHCQLLEPPRRPRGVDAETDLAQTLTAPILPTGQMIAPTAARICFRLTKRVILVSTP